MRTFSCLAVSLTSLLLAAGPALADPSGFISGGVGVLRQQHNDSDAITGREINLRGSASTALTPTLNIQGDVVLEYRRSEYDFDYAEMYTTLDGALHLFYREPEHFLAGGFVQFSREQLAISDSDEVYPMSRGLIGAEGQVFLNDVTLYGQAGYIRESLFESDSVQSGVFATAQLRYFLTPDFKIDVHGLVTHAGNEGYSFTTTGIGAGVEYRFTESPLSLFGTLDYFSSQSEYSSVSDTRIMVGVKFNFGSDSLKDQDRNGPSLDPYRAPFFLSGAT